MCLRSVYPAFSYCCVCEGAGPKEQTKIEYLEQIEDGSIVKYRVNFASEAQYDTWLNLIGGRYLVKIDKTGTANRDVLLTLEEVKDAAACTDSFLMLEPPTKFGRAQDVKELMAAINNRARAIEVKTTRSISSDQSVIRHYGDLQLINDGESVKFFLQGSSSPLIECDGLIKAGDGVVVLNEVKSSPKEQDLFTVLGRAAKMNDILKDLDKYHSVPPFAIQSLHGVTQVIPFLSGCYFPSELVEKCRINGINAVETNGSDYSVTLLVLPVSR
jgi:hypothetical protein